MKIETLLAQVMQRSPPSLAATTALENIPGWDSIMMVRLMLQIEERLGRELSEAEIEAVATVGDLQRLLG